MAKDGTGRGGARIGAGRKSKSLDEKILEGEFKPAEKTPKTSKFKAPKPKDYLSAEQRTGDKTCAEKVYKETYKWLVNCGCAEMVTGQLVESYAQMIGRHIQCEELLTKTGLLAKHPTTGDPIISPFVKASLDYLKSASQLWYQIYQIVKENGTQDGGINTPDNMMEMILRGKK